MTNKILLDTNTTSGQEPATTVAADAGEIAINIADKKIFARDAAGVPVVVASTIFEHSDSLAYKTGDLTVRGTQFLKCLGDIPAKAFDIGDWQVVSPPGDPGSSAILQVPSAADHNTVDLTGLPTYVGLEVVADTAQSANLIVAERSAIGASGVPNAVLSGNVRKITQIGHSFASRGRPVAVSGGSYVLADANNAAHVVVGIIEEVIDVNTFILRFSGYTDNLQASSFPGGTITAWSEYFVGATPGTLSLTPPVSGRRIPVLYTKDGTTGIVLTTPDRPVSAGGDEMSGGLEFGMSPAGGETDLTRHIALYGTTSGFNVSSSNQVNIVANAGNGILKLFADKVEIPGDEPKISLVEDDEASDVNRWHMVVTTTNWEVRPADAADAPVTGGLKATRDASGMVDLLATMSLSSASTAPDSVITLQRLIDLVYPIGILIESTVSTNPGTYIPGTTWVAYGDGRTTVGVGTADGATWYAGQEAGENWVTLTEGQMPSHYHTSDPGGQRFWTNTASQSVTLYRLWGDNAVTSNAGLINVSKMSDVGRDGGTVGEEYQLAFNFNHNHYVDVNLIAFNTNSKGGNQQHLNIQPSIGVYRWTRTA